MAKPCPCGQPKAPGRGIRFCPECIANRPCRVCGKPSPPDREKLCTEHRAAEQMIRHRADPSRKNVARNARRYGLTVEEYLRRIAEPCEACGDTEDPYIDHDHKTGKNRGTLCVNCNFAIGHAKDDPDLLLALAVYLIKYQVDIRELMPA